MQAPPRIQAVLTIQEKIVLEQAFGNYQPEVTKAEGKNNYIVIRFELGERWREASYDVDLSQEELDLQMEEDIIKWLKDIAKSLSEQEPFVEEIEELLGNYSVE